MTIVFLTPPQIKCTKTRSASGSSRPHVLVCGFGVTLCDPETQGVATTMQITRRRRLAIQGEKRVTRSNAK